MEIKYKNWILDSEEELYFVHWLEELQAEGYIEYFNRVQDPIQIFNKVNFKFFINNGKKIKEIEKFILHPLEYTPDFIIKWSKQANGKLVAIKNHEYTKKDFDRCEFYCNDDFISLVDVKGAYASPKLISAITFPIIQKILAYNGIFVQKVVPFKGLFSNTFTPLTYLFTKTGKQRTIKWNIVSVKEFLNR